MTKYAGRKLLLPVIVALWLFATGVGGGGITDSRGHAGENEGRSAIVALLCQGQPARDVTPVFGCPLFGKGTEQEEEFCDVSRRN